MGVAKQPVQANAERLGSHAQIDEQRTSPDVVARQEPPETAVVGLVAVIAHHPIVLRGDDNRTPVVRRRMIGPDPCRYTAAAATLASGCGTCHRDWESARCATRTPPPGDGRYG